MVHKITTNEIVSLLDQVGSKVTDVYLTKEICRIKEYCVASKIIKWKKINGDEKKREHKIYLHVYHSVDNSNMDKERVLSFYINSRKQCKPISVVISNASKEVTRFEPALSVLLGAKHDKKNVTLLKEIKKMDFFYKYPNTKNKFRYVYFKDVKKCIETIAQACENKNYEIVNSNIHNI
uniref:Uncharacterized protein n=1 Tax=Cryptophlebia leucotreta granulosis virus TaxID=35254 RepID=A0A2H4ZKE1_GVCL|nr:hypothetical protein [Cryptophlebia leucotreta granulovirus]